MKKNFTYIVAALLFSCSLVLPVAALNLGFGEGGIAGSVANNAGYDTGTDEFTLAQTVGVVLQAVFGFLAIIFTILIVMAGFQWMMARGDEEQVKKAQSTIRMAVIGVIIILASYSISIFILNAVANPPDPRGTDTGDADTFTRP